VRRKYFRAHGLVIRDRSECGRRLSIDEDRAGRAHLSHQAQLLCVHGDIACVRVHALLSETRVYLVPVPGSALSAHRSGVERLLASYRSIPATSSVRLAKPTSNLFRARAKRDAPGLDTSGLTGVINVDPEARTADVAGMCTYEDLVAATLPYGLTPLVVPQLKTITLGGAVTGLGIESASFRNGLPHESVLEMDILTGAGELITVSPDQHSDLYRAFPNSYG